MAKLDQVRKDVESGGIEFFFAQFVDMYARPSAKLVPASNLDGLVEEGAGFAGFAAGEIGQVPSDPDIAAMPDLGSYTKVPWQPNLARFACDVTVEGKAWPYCPRTASAGELKSAYRKLAMKWHPDRNPGDKDCEHRFKEINEAYDCLKDEQKRAAYDRFGHAAFEQGGMGAGGPGFGADFASTFSDI